MIQILEGVFLTVAVGFFLLFLLFFSCRFSTVLKESRHAVFLEVNWH